MALLPASLLVVGATWMTPSPSVRIPGIGDADALGLEGRLAWTVPHTSNPSAWYQWAPMAGCTAGAGCWRS